MFSDDGGLYPKITKTLAKSWLFRYMRRGRPRGMELGPIHAIPLAEARLKAMDCRRQLVEGIDRWSIGGKGKNAERLECAESLRFCDGASQYIEAHRKSRKNEKHAAQWESTIETYANPVIGDMEVAQIDAEEIVKVLEPIWNSKTETATRLRGRIESMLAWAAVKRQRAGLNPARWKGHLDHLLANPSCIRKPKHHAQCPMRKRPPS